MRNSQWTSIFALAILAAPTMFGAAGITPPNVTVGENLEVIANVALGDAAPENGFDLTLTSSDPSKVMFSKTPGGAGAASIQLKVRAGYRDSPDYYIQGFGKSGTVGYTASAPGLARWPRNGNPGALRCDSCAVRNGTAKPPHYDGRRQDKPDCLYGAARFAE